MISSVLPREDGKDNKRRHHKGHKVMKKGRLTHWEYYTIDLSYPIMRKKKKSSLSSTLLVSSND